ncbi:MAG: TolC family protein [Thermodesulfobacteriota bacterium]|nr:TolC family protein [Thermodesulfobacteriota bacterium]
MLSIVLHYFHGRGFVLSRLCWCGLILSIVCYWEGVGAEENATGRGEDESVMSLTLEEAINLALEANRNLLISTSNLESQTLFLTSAQSEFELKFAPSVTGDASDDYKSIGSEISLDKKLKMGPRATLTPGIAISDVGDKYSGRTALSLEMPLLRDFGREVTLDSVRSSEFSVRTAERSLYFTRVNTVLDTVFGVYDIIKQRELVELYDSQVKRLNGHAETAKIKEKVGLATPIDIYRAEIRLKDAEDSLTQAREALSSSEDALKLILAMPLDTSIAVTAPVEYDPINVNIDDAVEIAHNNRVELEGQRDQIREVERRSRVYKHRLLPQLNVVMNYEKYGTSDDFSESTRLDEDRWSINLVSTTDWARTAEKAAFRQSLLDIKTARLDLEARRDEITREVRRQLEALRKSRERIEIRSEKIKQAKGKLALAKIKFNYGMANNFDVIEAETELQQAQVDLLSTEVEYIVGTYNLRAVLGTLIERGGDPVFNAS